MLSNLRLDEDLIKVELVHSSTRLSASELPLPINIFVVVLHECQPLTRGLNFFFLECFVALVFCPNLRDGSENLSPPICTMLQ